MDFTKLKTPDWLVIGGGIGIFIFGFLDWVTISGFGASVSGGNVFDFFFTGTVPWILLIASAVGTLLVSAEVLRSDQAPWPLIIFGATALAAFLLLIRFIFNPIDGASGLDVGRGVGMILSVISGLAAAVGGYLGFQAAGGDIKDLTDMDKLKSSFAKDSGDSLETGDAGDTPPPPPPPPPPTQN